MYQDTLAEIEINERVEMLNHSHKYDINDIF